MFRISRRLDYGLQLMVVLASEEEKQPLSTASIAEKLQMPLPFMHQIAHTLMQNGLIKAKPGPRGGLFLSRQAREITLLQIVQALEGPVVLNPCLDGQEGCSYTNGCTSQFFWSDLQQKIVLHLESVSLDQLVNSTEYTTWMPVIQTNVPSSKV